MPEGGPGSLLGKVLWSPLEFSTAGCASLPVHAQSPNACLKLVFTSSLRAAATQIWLPGAIPGAECHTWQAAL